MHTFDRQFINQLNEPFFIFRQFFKYLNDITTVLL